jgi:hypothetical protein
MCQYCLVFYFAVVLDQVRSVESYTKLEFLPRKLGDLADEVHVPGFCIRFFIDVH